MEENRENESLLAHQQERRDVEDPQRAKAKEKEGPDRGYSWAVFGAIFWIYFLTGGIVRSAGVIYIELLTLFDQDRGKAAWPSSVATFFLCTVCPLAVVLSRNISNRALSSSGCLIASVAFILCYVCTSVTTVTLVLGVMFGISMGIIAYVPALIVSDYFDRYQEAIYSMVSISAPLGGIILPPIVEVIISAAGLHYFLLYFGCFLLTTFGAAFLFEKPRWKQEVPDSKTETSENQGHLTNSTEVVTNEEEELDIKHKVEQSTETMATSTEFYNTCHEHLNVNSVEYYDCLPANDESSIPNGRVSQGHVSFANGSYQKIEGYKEKNQDKSTKKSESPVQRQVLHEHLETIREILTCPMFWLITISQMIFMWVFEIYLLVIMDYVMDIGLKSQNASFVLAACSITDIIARLTSGSLSSFAKRRTISGISGFSMGLVCLLAAVSSNIYFVVVVSAFFGLVAGAFGASCVLAYADYIGIEKFSFVLGIAQFIAGIPNLFRPLIIGAFRNSGGSYNGLFYMNGAFGMVCGILWCLEPFLMKKQRTYERK